MMQPKHTGPLSMSFLIRTEWRPHLQNWGRSLLKGKSTLKPAQYLKSSPKPIRDSDRKHFLGSGEQHLGLGIRDLPGSISNAFSQLMKEMMRRGQVLEKYFWQM